MEGRARRSWAGAVFLSCLLLLGGASASASAFNPDSLGGVLDYGWLNKPLTPADSIAVSGRHFVRAGADGRVGTLDDERVRFFGVNLSFGANFPEKQDAKRIAQRLRRLGINLVRLHHLDSAPDERAEDTRSLLLKGPFPTLNPVAVARLRDFLDALSDEGIHANLNLHVGYRFDAVRDGVPGMPQGHPLPRHSKPLHVFDRRMRELQAVYVRKIVESLKLARDPVLAQVEINNESSLLHDWQTSGFSGWRDSAYYLQLRTLWIESGRAREDFPDEVPRPNGSRQARQFAAFLAEIDQNYLGEMLQAIRRVLPAEVPVAGTQAKYGGIATLWTHRSMDYTDQHFYIDHYLGEDGASPYHPQDWYIRRHTPLSEEGLRPVALTAVLRDRNKPLVLSEFNLPWPNPAGPAVLPVVTALASLQDWDGLVYFSYSRAREWDRSAPAGFELLGDHSRLALFGTVAAAWRSGDIRPLACETVLSLPRAQALRQAADYERPADIVFQLQERFGYDAIMGLAESRFGVELREAGVMTLDDAACPPSGLRLDARRMVVVGGRYAFLALESTWMGAERVGAIGLRFRDRGRFVTAGLRLLEGVDWNRPERVLIVVPGRTMRRENGVRDELVSRGLFTGRYALQSSLDGRGSVQLASGEPSVEHDWLEVTLPRRVPGKPVIHALSADGRRLAEIAVSADGGAYSARLNAPEGPHSFWFEIKWSRDSK